MAKKKSKKKIIGLLVFGGAGVFFVGIMLIMAAASAAGSEGGREASVAAVQESNLTSYISVRSTQQTAFITAAKNENTNRSGSETKGGDDYIEALYTEEIESSVSRPLNWKWDAYFVGKCMSDAEIGLDNWNADNSAFATKLNNNDRFHLPGGYLPKAGDIVFWGKTVPTSLSAGDTVNAEHCGIVIQTDTVRTGTEISAIQITVIEGDVEGGIVKGNYSHSNARVGAYTYDLYDTAGNSHYTMGRPRNTIIGYGTVAADVEDNTTSDSSDTEKVYYTVNLTSKYNDAVSNQSY